MNFLSLRLRLALINLLKEMDLAGKYRVLDVINTLRKLKISCIGGRWRLNEVTKAPRELFDTFGHQRAMTSGLVINSMHK